MEKIATEGMSELDALNARLLCLEERIDALLAEAEEIAARGFPLLAEFDTARAEDRARAQEVA